MHSFIKSQFSYCPLLLMFCSKELNKKINSLHKRALRIVYLDYTSSFEELLEKDKAVTIHQRNIQLLAIELFKVINRQGADIVWDLFTFNKDKKVEKTFCRPNVNTVSYGEQSIRYFGTVVWDSMVPPELKSITSLIKFKSEIEKWVPENCPCNLCKEYVGGVGNVVTFT